MPHSFVADQVTTSAIIVWLLQLAKRMWWIPWIDEHSAALNRFVAIIASGVGALGLSVHFDPTLGIATITGLTASDIIAGLGGWIQSYVWQQILYRGYVGVKNGGHV